MVRKVSDFCKDNNIIRPHETVVAGVSGGADSVCLLLILLELQREWDFEVKVVHVEHGIRGAESVQDAQFVENLCRKLGVKRIQVNVDVPAYARTHGVGEEEGARILRYEVFEKIARECGGSIALAHHMEDNAETIIFQMLRGSGLKGMCGMQPVRLQEDGVRYIRPLLSVSRSDIEEYLESRNQSFCMDRTNEDTSYSRNKLRQIVFPILEEVNSQGVAHINSTANQLSQVWDYMDEQATEIFNRVCCFDTGKNRISADINELNKLHIAIKNEVLYRMLSAVAGRRKDISGIHVENIYALIDGQSGHCINLPYGVIARKEFSVLILEKQESIKEVLRERTDDPAPRDMAEQKSAKLQNLDKVISDCISSGKTTKVNLKNDEEYLEIRAFKFDGNMGQIPKKTYTKWFDYDKIKGSLAVRTRRSGDYLVNDALGHTKKLKEYFINEKVPLSKRDSIWLLTKESEVIWIIGGRISEKYKVLEDSETIIEVSYNGGN